MDLLQGTVLYFMNLQEGYFLLNPPEAVGRITSIKKWYNHIWKNGLKSRYFLKCCPYFELLLVC